MWGRLQLLVAQGVVTLVGNETIQATVLDGETLTNLMRVEPYGFSNHPKPGAEAYLLFPSGDRSLGFAIVVGDKRYQASLLPGEVAIHDDEAGHSIKLGRNGITIDGGGHAVNVVNAEDLLVNGKSFLHHRHGSVQPGSGQSGEPI
ncbi:MAG: hypothetical protein CTY21_12195 [Methylomonas sp.]|nr:MAG: hypothetical protein CTY21_12195 [Methylomonas sp.]